MKRGGTMRGRRYLDPKIIGKISALEMRARSVVEGLYSGMHKSPYHGFSVEFTEYREYVPGDDTRHIDWRAYGKTDRHYIKRFEAETNLRCYLMLDASRSMAFTSTGTTKLEYGCQLAASLSYLMLRQQDLVGLLTFDSTVRRYIPPRCSPPHLRVIMNELEDTEPGSETDVARVFNDFAERIRRRGLIVVISDFFDDTDNILKALQHFRHRKHEVIVFHLLDPQELEFPFERMTLFDDLEGPRRLVVDPKTVRTEYMNQLDGYMKRVMKGCRDQKVDYVRVHTEVPFDEVLVRYLSLRHR
ncbi:DUF58 domain-containing protein [Planctomycetota bacterium]